MTWRQTHEQSANRARSAISGKGLGFQQPRSGSSQKAELMSKPIVAGRDAALAGSAERTPAVRSALATLSLSMLLSSLCTSIANVGLPTLAHPFNASFH